MIQNPLGLIILECSSMKVKPRVSPEFSTEMSQLIWVAFLKVLDPEVFGLFLTLS